MMHFSHLSHSVHYILVRTDFTISTLPGKEVSQIESIQSWVSKNKLASIGGLWAPGVASSLAYSTARSTPLKTSLKLIHAHAQALTLGVLSAAAAFHYYEETHKAAHAAKSPN